MNDSHDVQRLNSRLATMIRERLRWERAPQWAQDRFSKTIARLDRSIEQLKAEKDKLRERTLL